MAIFPPAAADDEYLILDRTPDKQQLNVPERILAMIQKNLFALKDLFDKNPHLFHASPGDPTANQEALKVRHIIVWYCEWLRRES